MKILLSLWLWHHPPKTMEYVEEPLFEMDEYLLLEEVDDEVRILVAYVLDVDHVTLLVYFLLKLHKSWMIDEGVELKAK